MASGVAARNGASAENSISGGYGIIGEAGISWRGVTASAAAIKMARISNAPRTRRWKMKIRK